jgi:hypothetical protein
VQKGYSLDYLLSLKSSEKLFLKASMTLAFDERVEEITAIKSLSLF